MLNKIQISPTKKMFDIPTIWIADGPEVDMIMDPRPPKGLSFRDESLAAIYAFGIVGMTEPQDVQTFIKNLFDKLIPGGELYVIENDFEYLTRSIMGGDLPIRDFNKDFRRATYLNQEELVRYLKLVGFPDDDQRVWFGNLPFEKAHYEMVISAAKPKKI